MLSKRLLILLFAVLVAMPSRAEELIIPANTTIPFSFLANREASAMKEGDQLPIIVTQDVIIPNLDKTVTIFKKDQKGYAEVFRASSPAHYCRSGSIYIHYVYIPDTFGKEQKLIFNLKRQEKRNPFTIVVPLFAVPIVWAIKGKNVSLFNPKDPNANHFTVTLLQDVLTYSPPVEASIQNLPNAQSVVPLHTDAQSQRVESVRFVSQVTERIRHQWQPPILNGEFVGNVTYVIDAQGGLSQVEVQQSSGNAKLDQSMVKAVQSAAPFPEALKYMEKSGDHHDVKMIQHFTYALQK